MAVKKVAFLGPLGTYSHLVAEKYFGRQVKLVPCSTILDVCSFVAGSRTRSGMIPIENSSGGAIYETVDILLENKPRITIEHEVSLDVRLALLGKPGETIRVLHSHFAPLEHCAPWIAKTLPNVEKSVVTSTAVAAERAAAETGAAALGSRKLASLYGLKVLHYPVEADIPNLTVFYAVHGRKTAPERPSKTTLAAHLPNTPGSLCTFLEAFRDENVNLSRIISRPIRGCPREYAFLVDIQGVPSQVRTQRALEQARRVSVDLRQVGVYPCRKHYRS